MDDARTHDDEWTHAVRNAINAVTMSMALTRRYVLAQEQALALEALARAEEGMSRLAKLASWRDGT